MPRANEEPEWDTDSEEESSSGEESGDGESEFEDEESSSGEESGDESASEFASEADESEGSEYGSESGSEEGSESESEASFEGDDSEDDSEDSEDSEDSSEDSEDSSEDEDPFEDEGIGDMEKGMSDGDLMNEPSESKTGWKRFVPNAILSMGVVAAAAFCFCIVLVPLLVIIIPLAVVLPKDKDSEMKTIVPTAAPTAATTPPTSIPTTPSPTATPVLKSFTVASNADTTIYRTGPFSEVSNGDQDTMLVQNGPPGDNELPSTYALVQFDGILGVDSDATSIEEYLSKIEDVTVNMCFEIARATESEDEVTYTTCILPSSQGDDIKGLTGTTANYNIPDDCLSAVSTFTVDSSMASVCVNVAPLLKGGTNTENTRRALRGGDDRRSLQDSPGVPYSFLFMIDALEASDKPGTMFFTSFDPDGRAPTLTVYGENTCEGIVDVACSIPEFATLCRLIESAGLTELFQTLNPSTTKTVFAPTNDAFDKLDKSLIDAIQLDTDLLNNVLAYHVVDGKVMSTDLVCGESIEMLNEEVTRLLCGTVDRLYLAPNGVSPGVNSLPEIIRPDIETCYGVIHVIDEVLVPDDPNTNKTCVAEESSTIAETACSLPEFSILCNLLKQTGFDSLLSGGLYTVFAPTDEALNTAFDALRESGMEIDLTDPGLITSVLLQHIIPGSTIVSSTLGCDTEIEMANGEKSVTTCSDDAKFISGPGNGQELMASVDIDRTDIYACNGIIHVITGGVIIPQLGVPEQEFVPCGICGEGLTISDGNAVIEVPESVGLLAQTPSITCADAQNFCLDGSCSPETCTAFADGISEPCGCVEAKTVDQVLAASPDTYSNFLDLADTTALASAFTGTEQDITVFAPTNEAFSALKAAAPTLYDNLVDRPEWAFHKTNLLEYHVLPVKVPFSDVSDGIAPETLNGESITITTTDGEAFVNTDSKITEADKFADNGVIHTISSVLQPSWVANNLAALVAKTPDLSSLNSFSSNAALPDGGLTGILSGEGPYTIFAPSNNAVNNLLTQGIDISQLDIGSVLSYHVVDGIYPASSISDGVVLTTLQGDEIVFSVAGSTVTVNGERIVSTDALANNGILHVVDGVLIPPGSTDPVDNGGAQTLSCSICSGNVEVFTLTNPSSFIAIPEGVSITDIRQEEATCEIVEEKCQAGFCDPSICAEFAEAGASETCGCVTPE